MGRGNAGEPRPLSESPCGYLLLSCGEFDDAHVFDHVASDCISGEKRWSGRVACWPPPIPPRRGGSRDRVQAASVQRVFGSRAKRHIDPVVPLEEPVHEITAAQKYSCSIRGRLGLEICKFRAQRGQLCCGIRGVASDCVCPERGAKEVPVF